MGQPLTDKHILIVEDEAVFRSVIAGYLTSLGASVREAVNGVDALAIMCTSSDLSDEPVHKFV